MNISEIIIDSKFTYLLQKYPNEEKCMVYPDGSDSKVEDYDKETENDIAPSIRKAKKRKVDEVITLDNGESDDTNKTSTLYDDEIIFLSSSVVTPKNEYADVIVID